MSSYLEIAERILAAERKPLTPRQILAKAYSSRIVPTHLYGVTQHKTLQARLSEDILLRRDNSVFFRPRPGAFFLRKFLTDTTIPEEFRRPISARRRTRDLFKGPALAFRRSAVEEHFSSTDCVDADLLLENLDNRSISYIDPRQQPEESLLVWAISVVIRKNEILTYRAGRYRDDRDAFARKQTVAFSSLVNEEARSLFGDDSYGVRETAVRAAITDLSIPIYPTGPGETELSCDFRFILRGSHPIFDNSLVAMVIIQCPDWLEPTTSRLSLNDLHWSNLLLPRNNMDDFDPWSALIWKHLASCRTQTF